MMRIGLMREQIEIWDCTKTINEYGIENISKELMLSCPAAVKYINADELGKITKSSRVVVEFTIRFNRYFKAPSDQMYIVWDNKEWDIILPPNNYWSLNKYLTLTAAVRSK